MGAAVWSRVATWVASSRRCSPIASTTRRLHGFVPVLPVPEPPEEVLLLSLAFLLVEVPVALFDPDDPAPTEPAVSAPVAPVDPLAPCVESDAPGCPAVPLLMPLLPVPAPVDAAPPVAPPLPPPADCANATPDNESAPAIADTPSNLKTHRFMLHLLPQFGGRTSTAAADVPRVRSRRQIRSTHARCEYGGSSMSLSTNRPKMSP